jgi:ribosomal protein L16 Arg81 hydroxylase
VQRFDRRLSLFTQQVSGLLGTAVTLNLYFTPPHSRCYQPHFDPHHLFIIQTHGRKNWQVSKKPFRKVKTDMTLSAGKILYLPKGFHHAAETGSASSVHLSLGIHPVTVHDALKNLFISYKASKSPLVQSAKELALTNKAHPLFQSQLKTDSVDQILVQLRQYLLKTDSSDFV